MPPLKSLESAFQIEWKSFGFIEENDKKAIENLSVKCLFDYKELNTE